MYKRLPALGFLIFSTLFLLACEGTKDLEGKSSVTEDLRLKSIAVTGYELSPAYDPDNVGPYNLSEVLPADTDSVELVIGEAFGEGLEIVAYRSVSGGLGQQLQSVTPGTPLSFDIDKGDNLLNIKVLGDDGKQFIEYRVNVHLLSDVADLGAVTFDDFNTSSNVLGWDTNSDFDPDTTEYELDAPFSLCSLGIIPFKLDRYASITVDGVLAASGSPVYYNLEVGVNTFTISVESEDESEIKDYRFTVTRAEAGDDLSGNNFLSDLGFLDVLTGDNIPDIDISAYRSLTSRLSGEPAFSSGFYCMGSTYAVRVNEGQTELDLRAAAIDPSRVLMVSQELASKTVGSTNFVTLVDPQEWNQAELYRLDDIEVGSNDVLGISLAADSDGDYIVHYFVQVVRTPNTWVYAESAAELNNALENAMPNQEIIAIGAISGEGIETDGNKTVFSSAASGTEEQPIVLRGVAATLSQANGSDATVLKLSGDHWAVSGLRLTGGGVGLVADGLNNSQLSNLTIDTMATRGMVFQNGSSNNSINRINLSNIGLDAIAGQDQGEAIVVGSNPDTWGELNASNDNNFFGEIIINPPVYGELIDIKEGVSGNRLINLVADASADAQAAEQAGIVLIKGNDNSLHNSAVFSSDTNELTAAVIVDSADPAWGKGNSIFSSYFNLSGAETDIVHATENAERVIVADNTREDEASVTYSGAAIVEQEAAPYFQLKWTYFYTDDQEELQNKELCLAYSVVNTLDKNGSVTGTAPIVSSVECDEQSSVQTSQKWLLDSQADGSILIRNASELERKVGPIGGGFFTSSVSGTDPLGYFPDSRTDLERASFLFWSMRSVSSTEVVFANKFSSDYVFSMVDPVLNSTGNEDDAYRAYDTEYPMGFISRDINGTQQVFELIQLDD
ncbi:cadherin-like beta sandwich domain-containing protein [Agaribacterium haliotis]|uniref:cadherin-like beta sandwich domain-containing protein n=1 Tax=Agaribacterium haliotis TaxID=2013869 RepID=UPI000BB55804|nr:cadherin-like beta sandwich domain-containing protein [Agaribacterium haliotis]